MGQKVNPHGARVGVIKDWNTRWYADKKNFADNLVSDAKLRKMIKELEFVDDKSKKPVKLYDAGISSIEIERRFDNDKVRVTVNLNVAKPGIVIGANGANIEKTCSVPQKTNIIKNKHTVPCSPHQSHHASPKTSSKICQNIKLFRCKTNILLLQSEL